VEVLAEYADRIIVLEEGRIALQGSPVDVFGEVARMAQLGLRVPQVTEFARAMAGDEARDLPVTTTGALRWLEARA
jgi:ABC-type hemin transport system ATPase subunit